MSLSQAAVLELLLCGLRKPTDRPQLLFEFTADPSWDQISLGCKHTLNWEERPGDGSTDCVNAFTCTSLRIVSFNTVMVLIFFFFNSWCQSIYSREKKSWCLQKETSISKVIRVCFSENKKKKKNPIQNIVNTKVIYR